MQMLNSQLYNLVSKIINFFVQGEGDLPEGVCRPPEELAELIEDVIFKTMKGTTPKYKNQVKTFNTSLYRLTLNVFGFLFLFSPNI